MSVEQWPRLSAALKRWKNGDAFLTATQYKKDEQLIVKAARQVANGTKEWLCQYPEFNDEACVVLHKPEHTRQPRKHSECGWFITIPTTEDSDGD